MSAIRWRCVPCGARFGSMTAAERHSDDCHQGSRIEAELLPVARCACPARDRVRNSRRPGVCYRCTGRIQDVPL